jgi:hypothetical protein
MSLYGGVLPDVFDENFISLYSIISAALWIAWKRTERWISPIRTYPHSKLTLHHLIVSRLGVVRAACQLAGNAIYHPYRPTPLVQFGFVEPADDVR